MAVVALAGTPASDAPVRRAISWRLIRGLVGIAAVVTVAWLVLVPQLRSAAAATRTVSAVDPMWLGIAVVAEAAALLAYARLSQHTLAPARIRFAAMLRIDLATLAIGHVTPAGSVVGAGLGYRLLTLSGASPAKAISGKAVQAIGSAVVLNLLLAVALGVAVARDGTTSLYSTATALIFTLLCAVSAVAVLLIRQPQRCADWAASLAAVLPGVQPASGSRVAASLTEALGLLIHDRRFLTTTAGWAAANWALDAAALWCAVAAFGHPLGPVGLGVAYGLANLFAAIPLTPGGLGVMEGVLLPVLTSFHTPHTDAVLAITTWRLLNFWAPIPIGLVALAITRRTHHTQTTVEFSGGARTDAAVLANNLGAPAQPTSDVDQLFGLEPPVTLQLSAARSLHRRAAGQHRDSPRHSRAVAERRSLILSTASRS